LVAPEQCFWAGIASCGGGHIVLGQPALDAGEIGKAKEHLLAAGRVEGSPALRSFGPDMILAKELLEKGEREAVIRHFDRCAAFWDLDKGKLAAWKEVVKNNGMPDVGPHLQKGLTAWRFAREKDTDRAPQGK
jgi:hypothetical protein